MIKSHPSQENLRTGEKEHPSKKVCEKDIEDITNVLIEKVKSDMGQIVEICGSTTISDKIVRLTSAVMKIIKIYSFIKTPQQLTRFIKQIGQLRRILRVNRLAVNFKDLKGIFWKGKFSNRNLFNTFFKSLMTFTDLNDMALYLMQLKIVPERKMQVLKKNTMDFYFLQCLIWLCQHSYEYYVGKDLTSRTKVFKKRLSIIKYIIDCITSYNDYSGRRMTLDLKISSVLGLISSILGVIIIWK